MVLDFTEIGHGKPVVLLHAFPLSNEMWAAQAEPLAARGFRVILPNFPGFGANTDSSTFESVKETARLTFELLNSLNIEKAIIGGLSLGGYVLFELFRIAPEKFSALILCDTTHRADTEEKRRSRFELISKIEEKGATALIEEMLPNLISEHTKQNFPELISSLKEEFSRVDPNSAAGALKAMAHRDDSADLLDKISVPALLIFGEFDKVTNLENAAAMNQAISESELKIIKNAGHYSNLEQPGQFNEILFDFCKRTNNF